MIYFHHACTYIQIKTSSFEWLQRREEDKTTDNQGTEKEEN